MSELPKNKNINELFSIYQRPKSKHTPEEILACSRKLQESDKNSKGRVGIVSFS